MPFARKIWKLLVAIKDGLVLVFLLLFFGLLYAALGMRAQPAAINDGALLLALDGVVVEEPADIQPLDLLLSNEAPMREYRVHDITHALRMAGADKRIRVIVLDLSRFAGAGQAHVAEIGRVLDKVRKKKPVLVYSQLYTDSGMQLAAHASEIWIDPMGAPMVTGPGGTTVFFGPLLERFKVGVHVFRVGTFKSAVEPYMRGDMSAEAKENLTSLYQSLWADRQEDIARVRPRANLAMATQEPANWLRESGGDMAKAALAAGLVDKIGDRTAFATHVAELTGQPKDKRKPGEFPHTTYDSWLRAYPLPDGAAPRGKKTIGIVTVAGTMVPGNAGPGSAGGDRIAKVLQGALDDDLSALVVRVDSPGGAVNAAEDIRRMLEQFRARKIPVVISMANVAASGGYWISTAADYVVAEPSTITGSIGVFAVIPSFERALANYGVNADGVRTTALSGQPDLIGGLTPEFNDVLQISVEDIYRRFLGLVATARHKQPEDIDAIGQGRVWSGKAALDVGLVDEMGGLDTALRRAAKSAKIRPENVYVRFLGQERSPLAQMLSFVGLSSSDDGTGYDSFASARQSALRSDWVAHRVQEQVLRLQGMVAAGLALADKPGIQAYCLECVPVTVAPPHVERSNFLLRMASFLTGSDRQR